MAFQSTVAAVQGLGVPGTLYTDSPRRTESFILESADASYNVFGRGFSKKTTQGVAAAGNAAGALPFAGILVNPQGSSSPGTSGAPLAPTLTLPNESQAELLTMGTVIVTLGAAAAVGDLVIYDNTTGILATITPSTVLPTGKSPAYATVDYFVVSASGLAVITLSPTVTYVLA